MSAPMRGRWVYGGGYTVGHVKGFDDHSNFARFITHEATITAGGRQAAQGPMRCTRPSKMFYISRPTRKAQNGHHEKPTPNTSLTQPFLTWPLNLV